VDNGGGKDLEAEGELTPSHVGRDQRSSKE